MRITPSITAIVAGTAPASRTAASTARAVSRFSGQGRPWAITVDSSPTTARPVASAPAISDVSMTGTSFIISFKKAMGSQRILSEHE